MLSNAEKLHFDVKTAVDLLSHEQQMVSSSSKDVTFLLRMGQSPVSLAKHQYIVHCQGILGLPEVQGAPAPIQTHRQPFGKKIGHSSKSADNGTRHAALERKLIRFLLYASQEDSIHGKTLSAQLGTLKVKIMLFNGGSFTDVYSSNKAATFSAGTQLILTERMGSKGSATRQRPPGYQWGGLKSEEGS